VFVNDRLSKKLRRVLWLFLLGVSLNYKTFSADFSQQFFVRDYVEDFVNSLSFPRNRNWTLPNLQQPNGSLITGIVNLFMFSLFEGWIAIYCYFVSFSEEGMHDQGVQSAPKDRLYSPALVL